MNHRPWTLLLVDDDPTVLGYVRAVLQTSCRILEAGSGPEAIQLLEAATQPVDVLLTDVHMMPMSGLELAQAVRQRRAGIKVLFMSGFSEVPTLVAAEAIREDSGFLGKPFTPASLWEKLEALLAADQAMGS